VIFSHLPNTDPVDGGISLRPRATVFEEPGDTGVWSAHESGMLRAVAYKNGKQAVTDDIRSARTPGRIALNDVAGTPAAKDGIDRAAHAFAPATSFAPRQLVDSGPYKVVTSVKEGQAPVALTRPGTPACRRTAPGSRRTRCEARSLGSKDRIGRDCSRPCRNSQGAPKSGVRIFQPDTPVSV